MTLRGLQESTESNAYQVQIISDGFGVVCTENHVTPLLAAEYKVNVYTYMDTVVNP